jgi:conjugal transfer pilus assembly protein TraK
VFGDEEAFVTQKEETLGQLFIKPTAENGTQAISLTVLTEQGMTQDLVLKPTEMPPVTLMLKPNSQAQKKLAQQSDPQILPNTPTRPEQFTALLKQAVLDELPEQTVTPKPTRPKQASYKFTFQRSLQGGEFQVQVFDCQNTGDTPMLIHESEFYQAGDLALSVLQHALAPKAHTTLYVITR